MKSPNLDPVVITGIGLVAANGFGREAVWDSIKLGKSGIRRRLENDVDIPETLELAAPVSTPSGAGGMMKLLRLVNWAAEEAIFDARIDLEAVNLDRFGCAISGHFGDIRFWENHLRGQPDALAECFNAEQWLPNSACWHIAHRFGLNGPRFSHSTACASGLIDILGAARSIQDGKCDIAIAGSGEQIQPLFAAGFRKMGVLAKDCPPSESCLPFDTRRHGFVMGEGAGVFVIERLSHAIGRNATIYAEIAAGRTLSDAHHVTSLNTESEALVRLIKDTLRFGEISPTDVGYVNAHGTGTLQNDLMESRGIRQAFGPAADDTCVSSLKSIIGHLVNASGSVELAVTALGMRDGIAPPTLNLRTPDPDCDLNFVIAHGIPNQFEHALKLSLAFGGHLVAAVLRRWNNSDSGFDYPNPAAENLPVRRNAA